MPSDRGVRAFVLAGGLGSRLRSVVSDRPKPMAPVGSRPFLEVQVEYLRSHGIVDLVFCVGHLQEQVRSHFGDGSPWGVRIQYSVERELLGTAGALRLARPFVDGVFVALNGDSYLETDLRVLLTFHREKSMTSERCLGTVALTTVEDGREYGSVTTGRDGRIESFVEKKNGVAGPSAINAGIYVLEPSILDLVPEGRAVSLEREVFPRALEEGFDLFGYPAEGFFVDIGTPAGYRRFQEYAERRLT